MRKYPASEHGARAMSVCIEFTQPATVLPLARYARARPTAEKPHVAAVPPRRPASRVPAVVAAGGAETRALGTRFDVYLPAGDGLQVTLLEGLVSVSAEAAGGNVILSPGEQMTLRSGQRMVARVDVSRIESWTTGMVAFTDATLAGAADELNRYSDIKLRVDEAIAGERISGSFRAGDQDAFAAALESFLPVVSERRGDEIVIHARE